MKALICVDIQNDFATPTGSLCVKDGEQIIPGINVLLETEEFGVVVVTQDWHPSNHKSFASNNPGKNVFEMGELNGLPQVMWPDHCVQGTNGAKLHPDLKVPEWAFVVRKGMNPEVDSYSAFYDNDHKVSTGLAEYLRSMEVNEVAVVGIATDYCCFATAQDAINEGFKTSILWNLTKAVNQSKEKLDELKLSLLLLQAAKNWGNKNE